MQTAPKVVSGRKYQTCVGIFAIHKNIEKLTRPPIKAVPAKNTALFASSLGGASGEMRALFTQCTIAATASAIHNHRSQGKIGAIATERFDHINAGRKPICDSTDQSCASRIATRYGSKDIAAGTPIASAASRFLKSWHRTLIAA